jgi:hypothetical protein
VEISLANMIAVRRDPIPEHADKTDQAIEWTLHLLIR